MDNMEAINGRRIAAASGQLARWQEIRLSFLDAILNSLRLAGIRA